MSREYEAARSLGAEVWLLDHDAAAKGESVQAIRRIPRQRDRVSAIYRGWMLRPERYQDLYATLQPRGVDLANSPAEYRHVHLLPEWYSILEGEAPRSVWTTGVPPLEEIMDLLRPFGAAPILLKDYVKSQKHDWKGACFIPDASDPAEVKRVLDGFLDWTGEDINGGLVFREFVDLEQIGEHPKSKTPLSREFRIWFLRGIPFRCMPYWEEFEYGSLDSPPPRILALGKRVQSSFFTMDVARTATGGWIVIELGEGQVSGLPSNQDAREFYVDLLKAWSPV